MWAGLLPELDAVERRAPQPETQSHGRPDGVPRVGLAFPGNDVFKVVPHEPVTVFKRPSGQGLTIISEHLDPNGAGGSGLEVEVDLTSRDL